MNFAEAEKQLDDLFSHKFNEETFTNFVNELFINFNYKKDIKNIPPEFSSYIDSFITLGGFTTEDKKIIKVYVVKLKKSTSRDRARTMQRNLIANEISKVNRETGALIAFYDDEDDWRLSFIRLSYTLIREKGELKSQEQLTSPKRSSFLVGPNEPNHTCRKQFIDIYCDDSSKPTLDEFENIFSVEKVTDEFFKEYKRLFLDLADSLRNVKENDSVVSEEFNKKDIKSSDFAKKLMGQLVFIYFLQKKGWLGVEENADWGTGPKNFLRKVFEECVEKGDNFFNDVLEHLFYKGLSEEVNDYHYSKFNYKVPFLNGGLFEPINNYDWIKTDIVLDNSIFSEILDTFDKFNFTIKEDEPLEKEVAVDPEMLGKVFENLLEVTDRKSKGAFYTPRHIVHYMCQENLIAYLNTNSGLSEEDLRVFITKGDLAINSIIRANEERKKYNGKQFTPIDLPDSIKENSDELERLLKRVKVIDPAVGSGAFPVGMMNEIVKARYILRLLNDINNVNMYELKRETIENSLYGVDLELSATDVTKLRFWLSLVVDEEDIKHIKPLPNLDNQIMCGNSLIDGYNDIKLFDDSLIVRSTQTKLSLTPTERAFNQLESKKREYFNTTFSIRKEELKDEIKELKWNFIETYLKQLGKVEWIPKVKSRLNNHELFIWELEFSEIFKGSNPGFDIVIGNPPYVRVQEIPHSDLDFYSKNYKLATGHIDMSVLFIELANKIIKDNGLIGFISSNMFLTTEYGVKLRHFLTSDLQINQMIDFGDLDVFSDAMAYVSIFIFSKSSPKDFDYCYVEDLNTQLNTLNFDKIEILDLDDTPWNLKNYELTKAFKKFNNHNTLKELDVSCNYGVVTGSDEVFAFKTKTSDVEDEVLIPLIRADRCERYVYVKPKEYVLYPYKEVKGKSVLLTEEELNSNFPLLKKYFDKNKEELSGRKDSRNTLENSLDWYKLMRPGNFAKFNREKIVYQGVTKHNKFTIDLTGSACAGGGVFFIINENPKISIRFVLAVLNSSFIEIFLHSITPLKRGGYHSYTANTINDLRIPLISLEKQKVFVNKVNKIFDLNNQINNINESFYELLFNKFNIDKLSKKLKKYYDLSFDELLVELKKKGVNVNDNNIKILVKKIYNEHLNMFIPLNNEVKELNNELNFLVYKLYDLNENEIKIIEENLDN